MNERLKDIIDLEVFLFQGVPEHKRKKTAMLTKTDHSELRHTPGPWKAEQADIHSEDDNRWSVLASRTVGDFFVATIENGAPGDIMATEGANARLIAAAPELLEACQELLNTVTVSGELNHRTVDLSLSQIREIAAEAINKAKNGTMTGVNVISHPLFLTTESKS